MADHRHNQRLNQLLIRVFRSLLQYTAECWPWASVEESGERQIIADMGQSQLGYIHGLVDLLVERGWPVDFGTYPTEYTDLHYIGLDFLLGELIGDEDKLIAELVRGEVDLAGDPAAESLVNAILTAERGHAARLRELSAARKSAAHPAATST